MLCVVILFQIGRYLRTNIDEVAVQCVHVARPLRLQMKVSPFSYRFETPACLIVYDCDIILRMPEIKNCFCWIIFVLSTAVCGSGE